MGLQSFKSVLANATSTSVKGACNVCQFWIFSANHAIHNIIRSIMFKPGIRFLPVPFELSFPLFSEFFSVVLSVFSSFGRVLSGRLLDGSPFRGWLLLGVAVERLLFTKDCSSQFPNLGSVELPIGS